MLVELIKTATARRITVKVVDKVAEIKESIKAETRADMAGTDTTASCAATTSRPGNRMSWTKAPKEHDEKPS